MNRPAPFRRRLAGAAALSLSSVLMVQPAWAQPGDQPTLSIPASSLGDALRTFSVQAGVPVIFTEALVSGRSSNAVTNAANAEAALKTLLEGTGLEAVAGAGGYVIRQKANTPERGEQNAGEAAPIPERVSPQQGAQGAAQDEADLRIDRVTVTGTSLRGIAPESSPLQIYSREDILASGVTTTEQFIRTLPQNFGGGSSEFIRSGLPNDPNASANNTAGTGANLRGLGSGATLTLLNGRRLAPSSGIGDFVDLSLIPVSAIERVEVLSDGASAIYGGDAVAGVINIVLRRDFQGAETGARFGVATRGKLHEYRLGQTVGGAWDTGNLLATYEYLSRDELRLSDRPEIAAYSQLSGAPVDTSKFFLMPETERNSLVVSGRQQFGPAIEVQATGFYSRRAGQSSLAAYSAIVTRSAIDSSNAAAGISAQYEFRPDWFLGVDASLSEVRDNELLTIYSAANGQLLRTADRRTQSSLKSLDIKLDGLFDFLPAGPLAFAVGAHVREEDFLNEVPGQTVFRDAERDIAAAYAEILVPLVSDDLGVPLVQRLELNASGRFDDYSDFGSTFNPKVGLLWAPQAGLKLRGSYSTSFAPPSLGRVGALDRTGSLRPFANVLDQFGVTAADPSLRGLNVLRTFGTAPDLEAEESRTLTLGADYEGRRGRHDWRARFTYYDISFEGRLGRTPVPGNPVSTNLAPNIAFLNPDLFPSGSIVFFPDAAEIARVLGSFNEAADYLDGLTPGSSIDIVNNVDQIRNLAIVETQGADLDLAYTYDAAFGQVEAGLNANHILGFSQKAAATSAEVETLNTLYNPVDLQLRGRLGIRSGGLQGSLFVNYKDSYRTDGTAGSEPVDSWTTMDLSLGYSRQDARGWLGGTSVSLSVQNLFDAAPPRTPTFGNFSVPGFDPANASALGRFAAVEVRKRF